jgi:transcription termination/antitermination protein NusG
MLQSQDDPWYLGQKIQITAGPFVGMEGMIYLIDRKAGIVRVKINVFGRPTPVELPFSDIKPIL